MLMNLDIGDPLLLYLYNLTASSHLLLSFNRRCVFFWILSGSHSPRRALCRAPLIVLLFLVSVSPMNRLSRTRTRASSGLSSFRRFISVVSSETWTCSETVCFSDFWSFILASTAIL